MKFAAWVIGGALTAAFVALSVLPRDLEGPGVARHFEAEGQGAPLAVAVIGTSLTAGRDWPGGLAKALAACSGRPVSLDTLAKPGAASGWGVTWAESLYARSNALLVIEFAMNDADIRRGIWPEDAARNVQAMVAKARKINPAVRIILLVPHKPTGVKRWLLRPFLGLHYQNARQLAGRLRLILIDLSGKQPGLPDGTHPSDTDFAAIAVRPLADSSGFCLASRPASSPR